MIKEIKSRVGFFVWGLSIAICGLISPASALEGIVTALKTTKVIK
jgi:hypothetical protein